jgi:hypothetical protein
MALSGHISRNSKKVSEDCKGSEGQACKVLKKAYGCIPHLQVPKASVSLSRQ